MAEHLEATNKGTDRGRVLAGLKAEIAADQEELKAIMARLHVAESPPRKAAGWLAGKLGELKLAMDDKARGDLHRLEALEALAVGIEGKLALWNSLEAARERVPELEAVDLRRLKQRAGEQRARVEELRLEAARTAFWT